MLFGNRESSGRDIQFLLLLSFGFLMRKVHSCSELKADSFLLDLFRLVSQLKLIFGPMNGCR
ncbi:hypothetical protein I3843_04G151900 [Carya illinoinensis]|nr:hypothetical protein I3843_04G151900 [Carya illinoinensis]